MITLLNGSKKVIALIPDSDVFSSTQQQELGGLITHTVEILYRKLPEEAMYFTCKDPEQDSWAQVYIYRIQTMSKDNNRLILDGVHEFFDDLKTSATLFHKTFKASDGWTPLDVLTEIFRGTGWAIGNFDVSTSGRDFNFYYVSPLEAFWEAVNSYRIEFRIDVHKDHTGDIRREVHFADRFDENKGKIYDYGDRLVRIVQETDLENVYTAFVGLGKMSNLIDSETGDVIDSFRKRVDFASLDVTTPIVKPQGLQYIEFKEATEKFGRGGEPRFAPVQIFDDVDTPGEVLELTYEYGAVHSRPQVHFQCSVVEDRPVDLGETVTIIRDDIDIRYRTRVFSLKRDFIAKTVKSFEFGERLFEPMSTYNSNNTFEIVKQEKQTQKIADVLASQKDTEDPGGGCTCGDTFDRQELNEWNQLAGTYKNTGSNTFLYMFPDGTFRMVGENRTMFSPHEAIPPGRHPFVWDKNRWSGSFIVPIKDDPNGKYQTIGFKRLYGLEEREIGGKTESVNVGKDIEITMVFLHDIFDESDAERLKTFEKVSNFTIPHFSMGDNLTWDYPELL